jgi:hypothetical protein
MLAWLGWTCTLCAEDGCGEESDGEEESEPKREYSVADSGGGHGGPGGADAGPPHGDGLTLNHRSA